MSSVVRWSALCDTNETVALAYYESVVACARWVSSESVDTGFLGAARGLCGWQSDGSGGGRVEESADDGIEGCEGHCAASGVLGNETAAGSVSSGTGFARTSGGDAGVSEERGKHYFRNKAKRERKIARRRDDSAVEVPEWRRKSGVGIHKGVFSECSSETQVELRETRAAMLVKQNKLSVLKAEAEARRVAAQLKSQVIERGIETQRVKQDSELAKLLRVREAAQPQGFAETVVSEGLTSSLGTPSLSDGSVSPDSSISVAELNKLRDSYAHMVQQVHDLTAKTVRQQEELVRIKAKPTAVVGRGVADEFFDADEGAIGVGDRRFDAFHFGNRFAF